MDWNEVLLHLLSAENTTRQQAEAALRPQLKTKQCVVDLLQVISTSPIPQIRQLAAVLLRRKVTGLWNHLNDDEKKFVKEALIQALLAEPERLVRGSIANLATKIAKFELSKWPELLNILDACSKGGDEGKKEMAMMVFTALIGSMSSAETKAAQLSMAHVLNLCGACLVDGAYSVRKAAMACVSEVGDFLTGPDLGMLQPVLHPFLAVMKDCLQHGDDDDAIGAMEVFEFIVEEISALGKSLPPGMEEAMLLILRFLLEVGNDSNADVSTREAVFSFVEVILRCKPKLVVKHGFLEGILGMGVELGAHPEDDDEEDEETVHKLGVQLLQMLGQHVPTVHVFSPMTQAASREFASPDPNRKRMALIILAILAEGCPDASESSLESSFLPMIFSSFQAAEHIVRMAACQALVHCAEYLKEAMIQNYQSVLPYMVQALNDPTESVRQMSCNAIESFCEELGDEILGYLAPLMQRLLELLTQSGPKTQEFVIPAIAATATASDEHFCHYLQVVLQHLGTILANDAEELGTLRARAMDAIGVIAVAVGKNHYQPFLETFLRRSLELLQRASTDPLQNEIRETSYTFLMNMAEIMEGDFAQVLPNVMDIILQSASSDDAIVGESVDNDSYAQIDVGDDDGPIDDVGDLSYIRTAFLDEIASAVQCLGVFAKHTAASFSPWMDSVFQLLFHRLKYFHEDIRRNAAIALAQCIVGAQRAYLPNFEWQRGVFDTPLEQRLASVINETLEKFLVLMSKDARKVTVAGVCTGIVEIGEACGPAAFVNHLKQISAQLTKAVKYKLFCQTHEADDEDEEDVLDHDSVLMDEATYAIRSLAAYFGPHFEPHFKPMFVPLLKFCRDGRSSSDRAMGVRTITGVVKELGGVLGEEYVERIAPVALKGLSDENTDVQRDGSYCLGILAENAPQHFTGFLQTALEGLHRTISQQPSDDIMDNACSAISRIITHHAAAIPVDQVLPLLLTHLPLRSDFEENVPVFGCILKLLYASDQVVVPHIPRIMAIFSIVLDGTYQIQPDIREQIVNVVKGLNQQFPEQMQSILANLQPQNRDVLAQHF